MGEDNAWTASSKKKYGVAVCNFHGKIKDGLPLATGESVHILEIYQKNGEPFWYRGYSLQNKSKPGIFPVSFIHIKNCQVDNEGQYESITPMEDQTAREVSYVLREWNVIWKNIFVNQKEIWKELHSIMQDLIAMRRTLLADTYTQDQKQDLKMKIAQKIDWGNKNLSLDLVPRLNGEQVDADKISIVQLYRIHKDSENYMVRRKVHGSGHLSNEFKSLSITNLLVNFKSFPCSVNEDLELYFSIYDAKDSKFISERFLVKLTHQGMPKTMEKLNNCYGLFTDLSSNDMEKDLWLVIQIYRIGKMLINETSKKAMNQKFKRPYGVAACSFRDINQSSFIHEEKEISLKVTSCVDKEELFINLHENIIKKASPRFSSSSEKANLGLHIGLQIMFGDLMSLKAVHPVLFNKGVDLVQKCMFPESLLPGEVRNDLYIVLNCGDFERGNKKAAKNVEVELTAFDSDGKPIPDCIYGGISEPPTTSYLSTVFYHNNNPRWMETIKFCLPIEKFTGAHIRLDLRHCSTRDKGEKKLFGFTFLKITSSDITLMDNAHTLCIYKCDSLSQLKNSSYINLPCTTSELNNPISSAPQTGGPHFQRSAREYIEVTSCLCSTKFTQNRDLLEILQWRTKRHKISSSLEKLASIQDIDIVRYLHDILDTLFDMFISDSAQPVSYAQNVFEALIHVFHLLTERKFKHYVPGFQSYLYETFSSSLVYRDLLFCLGQSITKVIDGSTDKILKQMFKVFDYLFQFIVQSNVLFVRTYTSSDATDFSELIGIAFKMMGKLVSLSNPSLHSSQVLLLTHLPSIYHSLLKLVSCQVITQHVANIVNEMPKELSESLLNAKLQLLHETVNTELIADKESRRILLNLCMSQIKRCFIHKKALQLAITVLEDILKYLYTLKMENPAAVFDNIDRVMKCLFEVIVEALTTMDDPMMQLGSLVSCLVEMLRLMDDQHYTSLFQAYTNKAPLKDFLVRVLLTFLELIKPGNFPSDWSVMRMVMNNVILTSIHYFARALSDHFLQADDFDYQLWNNYFNLAVAFITQPSLQLENFSVAKRQKIKERYQDMRVLLGFQMQTLWQELGQHKLCFIPCMIGPFLEVTLVPETELRKATLPILYDMMECEQKIPDELKTVENEIIEKLDIFITDDKGDTEYKELFHDILLEKVQAEPTLRENGTYFIQSVTDLLERLLDYRKFIDKEENRDKRMQCTYNILNFYHTGIKKEEMYIRYINKLYELHLSTDSYVEAGLTLRLYSELLDWNDSILASEMRYHAQQEWERKEKLYLEIIDCFDRGKVWEYGIPLCKELASLYESKLYNYQELSKILQKEAKFFENILEGPFLRQDPCYYRVAYYGNSFPKFVQNKVFVYRGDECLKLQTIMTHLTTEYPLATILNHNNPPDDLMKQGEQQYIQISCVKPVENKRAELDNPSVPREIKFFYQVNEVDTFLFDRPYHRGERDKNNEFKTLCIERSILKTTHKLPGILRWYEVDNVNVQFLTPIEVAIDMMKQATKDLIIQTEKCRISPKTEIPFLSLKLNGMISACVNGGVAKYQEAFFSPEYSSKYSSELHFLEELKNVMMEQMHALEASLELHGKETNEEMQPLHKEMEDQLCITKRDILRAINSSPSASRRLLTPPHRHEQAEDRPGTPSTGSVHSNSSNRSSTLSTDTGFHDEDNPSNYYSDVKEIVIKSNSQACQVPSEPTKTTSSYDILSGCKDNATPQNPYSNPKSGTSVSSRKCSTPEFQRRPPPPLPQRLQLGEDSKTKQSVNGTSKPPVPPKTPKTPVSRMEDQSLFLPSAEQPSVKPRPTIPITPAPPLPPRKASVSPTVAKTVQEFRQLDESENGKQEKPPPLPKRLSYK